MTKKDPFPITHDPLSDGGVPAIAVIGGGYWGKNLVRNYYHLDALKLIADKSETILSNLKNQFKGG
jgi:UDP-2-acetamido-3-amino-2,3-dideoxy-glucuronate N-acetyltransferase